MNNNWSEKKTADDIMADIARTVKTIREQSKNPRRISFREALMYDNNILALAGYSQEQINHYNKMVIEAIKNEKHNNN